MKTPINSFQKLLLFTFLICVLTQCSSQSSQNEEHPDINYINSDGRIDYNKLLQEAANETNKGCPMMADKETRFDNCSFSKSDYVFRYNYTLVNQTKSNIDIKYLTNYITPILINAARTNPNMKDFLKSNVTLCYYYNDKNGDFLMQIFITPEQYTK